MNLAPFFLAEEGVMAHPFSSKNTEDCDSPFAVRDSIRRTPVLMGYCARLLDRVYIDVDNGYTVKSYML